MFGRKKTKFYKCLTSNKSLAKTVGTNPCTVQEMEDGRLRILVFDENDPDNTAILFTTKVTNKNKSAGDIIYRTRHSVYCFYAE